MGSEVLPVGEGVATFSTMARTPLDLATSARNARIGAGMSQADLTSAAHLNRSWVSLSDAGHNPNASLSTMLAMLHVHGISVRLTYSIPESDPSAIDGAPGQPRSAPACHHPPGDIRLRCSLPW